VNNIEYTIPVIAIIVVFFVSLYRISEINILRLKDYYNNRDNYILDDYINPMKYEKAPGIMMSIGIIGTFVLIFLD